MQICIYTFVLFHSLTQSFSGPRCSFRFLSCWCTSEEVCPFYFPLFLFHCSLRNDSLTWGDTQAADTAEVCVCAWVSVFVSWDFSITAAPKKKCVAVSFCSLHSVRRDSGSVSAELITAVRKSHFNRRTLSHQEEGELSDSITLWIIHSSPDLFFPQRSAENENVVWMHSFVLIILSMSAKAGHD